MIGKERQPRPVGLQAGEHFAPKSAQIVLGQFLGRLLLHVGKRMVEGLIGLCVLRAAHPLGVKFDKRRGQALRAALAFC
jgi:hypothetical protein